MATTEKLQNEILLKEEAFLKEEKAKLTEQLNKLKVEEMSLMKLLKPDNKSPHHKTLELFTNKSQLCSISSQSIDHHFETETEVNHIPLQPLKSLQMNKDADDEQEEEYDDDDDDDLEDDNTKYSQQLINAMSNLHYQNSNTDPGISRSVFHSIMQQEIEDIDLEEDGYFH